MAFIIIEGPYKGIWTRFLEFEKARDEPYKRNVAWSYKAGFFWCLEDAKNWIQARSVYGVMTVG
jgi:hypothetical protein